MVQKLYNLTKWGLIDGGKVLSFPSNKPRAVRLDVNAPSKVELSYINADGEVFFLALVEGRDTIDFTTTGKFSVATSGDCYVHTVDGEDVSYEVIDPIIFTRIVARRARSPELERLEQRMMMNINRRLEKQRGELEDYYSRRERDVAALAATAAAVERANRESTENAVSHPEGVTPEDDGAAA